MHCAAMPPSDDCKPLHVICTLNLEYTKVLVLVLNIPNVPCKSYFLTLVLSPNHLYKICTELNEIMLIHLSNMILESRKIIKG